MSACANREKVAETKGHKDKVELIDCMNESLALMCEGLSQRARALE